MQFDPSKPSSKSSLGSNYESGVHRASADRGRHEGTSLLRAVGTCVYMIDTDGRVIHANPAALEALRIDETQVLGKSLASLFRYQEHAGPNGSVADPRAERGIGECRRSDGTTFPVEYVSSPLADERGGLEGTLLCFRDVSEQRRLEAERRDELARLREELRIVRKKEERFRLMAEATSDAIWDRDILTGDSHWSAAPERPFGFIRDEITAPIQWWSARVHPEDREAVLSSIKAALEGAAGSWAFEYRFLTKYGAYAYVLDRALILRDESGKATRMIGGLTDISERKRAEEKLREQATLLDKAQDAIIVRDLQHRILYWNQGAERLYGWSADEVLGRSAQELLCRDPAPFLAANEATIARGEWVGELEQQGKHGQQIIVEGRWTLVRDQGENPKSILAINTNLTERKKLEAQFLRAQRLESIGTLAGGIAHDLNNVFAPILMTTSLLRQDEGDLAKREDLLTIEGCARRGSDMVRQLLSFARGVDGRRTKTDLGQIAGEIETIVKDTFPKDIVFRLQIASDLWKVNADATQLHQLLTNLCLNARDAMPHGGNLTVTLENVVLDELYAGMHPEASPGPYVVANVEDTGLGMSPDIQAHIFEPFFTTKDLGVGTGLGLSTAHSIVRNHGGFIRAVSQVGQGSRFTVCLPATSFGAWEGKRQDDEREPPRGSGEVVLFVDDEEPVRSAASRTLEHYGYRVVLASNGAEAVGMYAQQRDEIAVVVTDMMMPVMDGPAVVVALRSIQSSVRIIGSSGLLENTAKAVEAGIESVLQKPYTAHALIKAVQEVLVRTD